MILPMLQKNLFIFFKNCFLHWPLDSSFKVVSEFKAVSAFAARIRMTCCVESVLFWMTKCKETLQICFISVISILYMTNCYRDCQGTVIISP